MNKLLFLLLLVSQTLYAQPRPGFDRHYHFLNSGNLVADKNFYLLTVLEHDRAVRALLLGDSVLSKIYRKRRVALLGHVSDTCNWPASLLTDFLYGPNDSSRISLALENLYSGHLAIFNKMINTQIRPSGNYERWSQEDNKVLLLNAWESVVKGNNGIINRFGFGKKPRYPAIDSATYNVYSNQYRGMLKELFAWLASMPVDSLFFLPSLAIDLQLMDINGRDEPSRLEPLEKGVNRAAYNRVASVNWSHYKYSCILLLGSGNEIYHVALSPTGKMRADIAAIHYLSGDAPFIIASGGYVAPFRTEFCEALEMKRYLLSRYHIPESAIIAEPFARHTTTNIRNANRLIFRYGIPPQKPVLVVSSKSHVDGITDSYGGFDRRNLDELGYLPYTGMKHVGLHEAVYFPSKLSLQMDPLDPLDP